MSEASPKGSTGFSAVGIGILVIVLLCLAVYLPAFRGGFLWDDDDLVTENCLLRSAEGLREIWASPRLSPQGYYWPLLYTFLWIQYHLWGLQPFGYHAINVILHVANALLVWRLLDHLRLPGAWLAAAIFVVHPVHVESVAWVAEQKNMLSTVFYLVAFLSYLRFDEQGNRRAYGVSVAFFVCAALVKSMTLSLPAALLICLWARHARVRVAHVVALAPFFVLAAALGTMQLLVYSSVGALAEDLSIGMRLILAGRCLWFYLGKLVVPVNLMAVYPRWQVDPGSVLQYGFPLTAATLPVVLWFLKDRIGKWPCAAVCFYGVGLLPMLHLIAQKGFISITYVNDHAQYLASIGAIALFAGFLTRRVTQIESRRREARLFVPALLFVLTIMAAVHVRHFRNMETLFTHTLSGNPEAWPAHVNLGTELLKKGDFEKARFHYEEALRVGPDNAEARKGLGILHVRRGEMKEAIVCFEDAVRFNPRDLDALQNLGLTYFQQGRLDDALSQFERALAVNPLFAEAHFLKGNVLVQKGLEEEARESFEKALMADPAHAGSYHNLGFLHMRGGRLREAAASYRRVIRLQPGKARAHYDLGWALAALGERDEARTYATKATSLARERGDDAVVMESLELLARLGGKAVGSE